MHNLYRSTGAIWPMSIPTSMTWLDIGALLNLIHIHQVRTVVEIGTHRGGFAAVLTGRTLFDPGFHLFTVELDPSIVHPDFRGAAESFDLTNVQLWIGDAFAHETRQRVIEELARHDQRALLFCDGGDKPREMREFHALLRPGDLMVGHDYHNEYNDEGLPDIPYLERLAYDWLDETLLVAYRRR